MKSCDISFVKYDPLLAKAVGRGGSLFINTLQFFLKNPSLGKSYEEKKWIYNTIEQWAFALRYSTRQVERIISHLRKKEILIVKKLNSFKGNTTNYYTINEEKLKEILQKDSPSAPQDSITSAILSDPPRQNGGSLSKNSNKEENNKSEEIKKVLPEMCLKHSQELPHPSSSLSPQRNTIAQDMLAYWNRMFKNSAIKMSKQIAPLLIAAYTKKFSSSMEKWENYCHTLASSKYLTSNRFTLSLFWALKYNIIDRIHNKEFGVQTVETSFFTRSQALQHIENLNEAEDCKKIRINLLNLYGEKAYKSWFLNLEFEAKDGKVFVKFKNLFIKDYLCQNYSHIFSKMSFSSVPSGLS